MKRILYYISGHGYGHATRSIEVIKNIRQQNPQTEIHIQSNAPRWLFLLNLKNEFHFIAKSCDVGAVQKNSFDVDQHATLSRFANFYASFSLRIAAEKSYIQKNKIDRIVGDVPPLAFLAAEACDLPSVAIANFSWDWIYTPYAEKYPEYAWVPDKVKEAYGKAGILLRLPLHGDLHAFRNITDIPFIAREARMESTVVRKQLQVGKREKLILVALRREDLAAVRLDKLAKLSGFRFLFFSPVPQADNFISVAADFLPFPNLIAAGDLVVSKPGYGIVSECLANRTPLLYTARKNFREYDVLTEGIEKLNMGRLMNFRDFIEGDWQMALAELLDKKISWPDRPVNGAEIAAQKILTF